MRLTVGGALIFIGIGAAAGFMVADKAYLDLAKNKVKGLTDQAGSLVGLFKFGESEKKPEVYSPPPPFPTGSTDQATGAGAVGTSTEGAQVPGTLSQSPTQSSLPAVAAPLPGPTPIVQAKPAKKTYRKSKRAKVSKKTKPVPVKSKASVQKTTAKVAPKPAATKDRAQGLVGTYVTLELVTGRSVQGVLESKSATHYSLNVPGLGPLEYPVENVKTIQPAQ